MAYTTIDDGSAHFQTATYTGTGSNQSITNGGNSNLQPDWVWVKDRGDTNDHKITDSSRLANSKPSLTLESNTTNAQYDDADPMSTDSFDSDGFTIGTNGNYNTNTNTYVAWQWKANGGTTSSNTSGNITTTVQANTTAGFSIVTWEGANSTATLGHGLGAVPEMIISKCIDTTQEWGVYHKNVGNDDYLHLNENAAEQDNAAYWNDTTPTSTVWSVGNSGPTNDNGDTMIAYVFTPIQGYSKFGSYVGNGNTGGPFIYLGFKPAFFLLKSIDITQHWYIFDTARDTYNPSNSTLQPSTNNAQQSGYPMDFLSNGFKIRHNDGAWNGSGNSYIYMAFAEHPFVSSKGVPVTAR